MNQGEQGGGEEQGTKLIHPALQQAFQYKSPQCQFLCHGYQQEEYSKEEGLNATPAISTAPAHKDMPNPTA